RLSTLWLFPFSSHHGVSPLRGSNALDLGRTLAGRGVGQRTSSGLKIYGLKTKDIKSEIISVQR
ncbi:MAG: hypothetical protein MPF33_07825, partial [Candidatus Aramenus sp.]|nr:hypothetical protein [Candidatus Aramenus sp.]